MATSANQQSRPGDLVKGCLLLIVLMFFVSCSVWIFWPKGNAEKIDLAECLKDLSCWGDHWSSEASLACKPLIEKQALIDFKWEGWVAVDTIFTKFAWRNADEGILTYYGDKVRFQNAFGTWLPHWYWCDFDPETKIATVVELQQRQ